jgi:hypothetical protein
VGAPASSEAFLFERNGEEWPLEQRLFTNEDATQFGNAVALQGTTAVIGAILDDTAGVDSGAAYVFTFSGKRWDVDTKLTVGVGVRTDEFGSSVAVDGNTIVVGARFRDDADDDAGSAYVFTLSGTTWNQQAKLVADEGQESDAFGTSVALFGNVALVGAPGSDLGVNNAGASYLFIRDGETWTEFDRLLDPLPNAGSGFGTGVALGTDIALIGSPFSDDGEESAGTALLFSF